MGTNKIRIAVIGIAHVHALTYLHCIRRHDDAQIIGIWDSDPQRVLNGPPCEGIPFFSSCEDLLAKQPHFALVCTENTRHEAAVLQCAAYGVDVLCEKPLGTDRKSMDRMIAACGNSGIRLMTAFPNRYIHSFLEAKTAVENGAIGSLLAVQATNKGTMPGGWFTDPALSGGGCLIDHTVHVADLMNWLLKDAPVAVRAVRSNRLYPGLGVEDAALVQFRYPSGVFVSLDASWSRMAAYPYGRDLTMRFIGTEGSLFIDYFAENNQFYPTKSLKAEWSYYGEDKDQIMIDDIISCYHEGRSFPITGEDGRRSALVAQAAYLSEKLHREVFLSELS